MKTYPHQEDGQIIKLVRKDEHDAVVVKLNDAEDQLHKVRIRCGEWAEVAGRHGAEIDRLRADNAELLERLRERTESHLAASNRDVATIQRQAVELSKWQALARQLAEALEHCGHAAYCNWVMWFPGTCTCGKSKALAAYAAAKSGEHAYAEIRIYENNDGWPRRSNLPDPLAEAVKRMKAVSLDEMATAWANYESSTLVGSLEGVRDRLIQAAKGERP